MFRIIIAILVFSTCSTLMAQPVVYDGDSGPGAGKHLVFLAGDHEYRSEETLPALARILAKRYGFKCTVLFTVDAESGEIIPGSSFMPGMEALDDADLMVIFLRFQDFPREQMRHIVSYLDRAGPVVGLRTSTHAFKIPEDSEFARYSYRYSGSDYELGFGRQVLGETWAGHYGKNHEMSTRLDLVTDASEHPILRGVSNVWVQSGGYWTEPMTDSTVLAMAQPLEGMTSNASPAEGKVPCPGAWTRTYQGSNGQAGRVFTSTYGASEDILNDGYRRLLVNACMWAVGLENAIEPDAAIDFVGPYHPTTFRSGGHRQNVRPVDVADWDSPIFSPDKPIAKPQNRREIVPHNSRPRSSHPSTTPRIHPPANRTRPSNPSWRSTGSMSKPPLGRAARTLSRRSFPSNSKKGIGSP